MFGVFYGFGGPGGFSNLGGAFDGTDFAGVQAGAAQASGASASAAPMAAVGSGMMGSSPFGLSWGGQGAPNMVAAGTMPSGMSTPSPWATAEKTAFGQLKTDEGAIHDKSQVTPALQAAFRNDLTALGKETTKTPGASQILALKSDLATVEGTLPTSGQLATIQTDFTAVLTSAGVTDTAGVTKTFSDLNALLAATNIGSGDISTLTADLKAAGQSTSAPLLGMDIGVKLDSLLSTVVIAGVKATASSTATPASTTSTTTTAGSTSTS
jgi:hypothetical protein